MAEMRCREVKFSGHALRRMFERKISVDNVLAVIASGEVITEYPEDTPFPSYLILGFMGSHPIHVVVARDKMSETCYIITAYPPDPFQWSADFKTRRTP